MCTYKCAIVISVLVKDQPQLLDPNHPEIQPQPNPLETMRQLAANTLAIEQAATALQLDAEFKIRDIPPLLQTNSRSSEVAVFQQTPGVLDAQEVFNSVVVIYNTNDEIPAGCRDLFASNRSAEYDPDTGTMHIDIADAWNYLEEKYDPALISSYVAHELRHSLVNIVDQAARKMDLETPSRYEEVDASDAAIQLMYLDELHSLFFDTAFWGARYFADFSEKLTTVRGRGSHAELCGSAEAQTAAEKLFSLLQVVLKFLEVTKDTADAADALALVYICGSSVCAARDCMSAAVLVEEAVQNYLTASHV